MQTTPVPAATRERILEVALELFARQGYLRTSVRDIAERVGVTKAAVHYHFPRKIDIMLALAHPVWHDFEIMISESELLPDPRWQAIEGWLDVLLKHRRVFEMISHDPALITDEKTYADMFKLVRRVLAVFAGPDPTFSARMRAAQVMAVLSDPVLLFPEVPDAALRAEALAGVRRLLADMPFGGTGDQSDAHAGAGPLGGEQEGGLLGEGSHGGGAPGPAAERHVGLTPRTPSGPLDGGRMLSGEGNTSPPGRAADQSGVVNGHAANGPLDGGRLLSGEGNTSPPDPSARDARPRERRRPGRPAALSYHGRLLAQRMHAEGLPAEQIASALGVSRATIYRYLQS